MEIKIGSKQILFVLHILSWIIFVGLCIEAGGFITNSIRTYYYNPAIARNFWNHLNFESLYKYDSVWFLVQLGLISLVVVLKAIMFYCIINLFMNNKINLEKPFNENLKKFLFILSFLCFGIGYFSNRGLKQTKWLLQNGVTLPDMETMHFSGGDVWNFIGIILIIIAFIFKRGIEIQNENDLTI